MIPEFEQRFLSFISGGNKIAASAHLTREDGPKTPAVLLCHGFTGNRIEQRYIFVRLSRQLSLFGLASLRFDFRGCGESEGLFKSFTLVDHVEDAKRALEVLQNHPRVDADRIGLLGYSLGGCIAAVVAGECSNLKTVVLWSPVAFPGKLFYQQRDDLHPGDFLSSSREYIEYDGWAIGIDFIRSLDLVAPVKSLAGFAGPVLLCHGRKDKMVDVSHSRAYLEARNLPDLITESLFLPESGHGYKPLNEDAKLLEKTTLWYKQYLK